MNNALTIFKSLQGKWNISRIIFGFGRVKGVANFQEIESEKDALYYKEEGVLTMENGVELNVHREYVYRYENEKIKAFFVENNKIDKLFHVLSFDNNENGCGIQANASHKCINDTYYARYNFFSEKQFKLTYNVKGPEKDYVSETVFDKS
jgi:hypothetical protein